MYKTISRVLFFVFFLVVSAFSYTASYKCIDRKDGYILWVNIDENSLHYGGGKHFAIFNYNKTVKFKNNSLVHLFSKSNVHYTVHQAPSNPIDIYIDDYKDNKIRYEYKCKLGHVIENNSEIPVTWRAVDKNREFLKKISVKPK